jgi:small subunit ribosomal protein S17
VHHVVNHIIAPYGTPIEERPPVPTLEERVEVVSKRKEAKDLRRGEKKPGGKAKTVVAEEVVA